MGYGANHPEIDPAGSTIDSRIGPRFGSLDGLRGIAAFVVLAYHLTMVVPSVALLEWAPDTMPRAFTFAWWVGLTPLKVFTAGGEAVLVFFVLSGFVLSIVPLGTRRYDWLSYMPRRVVRLYLPTIASVLLGALLAIVVTVVTPSPDNPWLIAISHPTVTAGAVLKQSTILFANPLTLSPATWSLVWEVLFSLLLPLFIAITIAFQRLWWVGAIAGVLLTAMATVPSLAFLHFLPLFLVGCCLASGIGDLERVANRLSRLRFAHLVWSLIVVVALLLLVADRLVLAWPPTPTAVRFLGSVGTIVGASILVCCAAFWSPAVRFLTTAVIGWLGRVSFSLYLVHLPILLAIVRIYGDAHPLRVAAIALPVCLGAAQLFSLAVERPAHKLSQRTGRWLRDIQEARSASRATDAAPLT